jgi:hypothetical protein
MWSECNEDGKQTRTRSWLKRLSDVKVKANCPEGVDTREKEETTCKDICEYKIGAWDFETCQAAFKANNRQPLRHVQMLVKEESEPCNNIYPDKRKVVACAPCQEGQVDAATCKNLDPGMCYMTDAVRKLFC